MVERKEWEIRAEKAAEKLNLKWYRNADGYSDGDVEDDILKYIAENKPEDYDRVIEEHYNWPVFYHLTHIRKKSSELVSISTRCFCFRNWLWMWSYYKPFM